MLTLWDFGLIILALGAAVAVGAYFFSKTRIEPAGMVRANDFTDERLRMAVIRAAKGVDVASMTEEKAEEHLEELARHAIAKEYAQIYPGLKVEVTPHWPDAKCMISGNIALIRPWVGRSVLGGSGIRAVSVEVNRHATLNLTTKRPIKAAWEDLTTPPAKAEPVAPRLKVAAGAASKPVPPTTTPPRAAPARKRTLS